MMCYYLNVQFQGQSVKTVGTWNCIGSYSECPYVGYLLRNYVTDTTQQNTSCKVYSSLGSQEIPHIL